MKKYIFLILLICSSTHFHAQINWLKPGAKWYYDFFAMLGDGLTTLEVLEEDTLVGGVTFKRLLETTYFIDYSLPGNPLDTFREMHYAREQNNAVLSYEPNYYSSVLYDLSKLPGDTLTGMLATGLSTGPFIVDSIDTLEIEGRMLAFQDIRFPSIYDTAEVAYMRVIEGIGSLNSHFFHSHTILQPFDAPFYYPRCYEDPDIGIIHFYHPDVACDAYLQIVATESPVTNGVTISPNPTTGIIKIQYGEQDLTSLRVIDLQGKMVFQQNVDGETDYTVDLGILSSGIYLLMGSNANGNTQFLKRVVVQREQ